MIRAVFDYVVEKYQALVTLALVEGHLQWVRREGSTKDTAVGQFVPDISAPGYSGHGLNNDLSALGLRCGCGLFSGPDMLAVACVVINHLAFLAARSARRQRQFQTES